MENISRLEAGIIVFLVLFIVIFVFDYFFIKRKYLKKKRKKKNNELMELSYLINKFNLNRDTLNLKRLLFCISFINAFIISLVSVTVLAIDTYVILKFIIGFILLIALIYAIYELLGRFLERKYKNGL